MIRLCLCLYLYYLQLIQSIGGLTTTGSPGTSTWDSYGGNQTYTSPTVRPDITPTQQADDGGVIATAPTVPAGSTAIPNAWDRATTTAAWSPSATNIVSSDMITEIVYEEATVTDMAYVTDTTYENFTETATEAMEEGRV